MSDHLFLEVISGLTNWIPHDAIGYLIVVFLLPFAHCNKNHQKEMESEKCASSFEPAHF